MQNHGGSAAFSDSASVTDVPLAEAQTDTDDAEPATVGGPDSQRPASPEPTAAVSAAKAPLGRRRGRAALFGWLKVALLIAMVAFAASALVKNWDEVSAALARLNPWVVGASLPPVALAMVAAMMVWRSLLADLGAPLPIPVAARIFFLSQLGKYLPGSIWSIATQIELGREHKVPRRVSLAVGVLALVITAAVGFPVAAVTLLLAAPDVLGQYWWGLLAVPVLLTALHPAVLAPLANVGFRIIRQPPLPRRPTVTGMVRAAAWQALVSVLFGVHAWLLLLGTDSHAPVGRTLLAAIGGYALAYALGLLAIPVPAGLGVRDLALTAAFTAVVPLPAATAVAAVSRVALTVVDLTLAGGQYALIRWAKPATPPAETTQ